MTKRLLIIFLLAVAYVAVPLSGSFARTDGSKKPVAGLIAKIFKHRRDSLPRENWVSFQDTVPKKIKEIAPAKRQPKPERIDEQGGRPDIISKPGFPGADNIQPRNIIPRGSGGSIEPRGGQPHGGSHGGGARPQGGSGPGQGGGGRRGG